ncbi:hypothetical protein CDD83_1934 [Cordyceps sp. RAO-2017]|nr:hypothetical protein CDD83_1934 [Cordyceps sp. RAO-2017]
MTSPSAGPDAMSSSKEPPAPHPLAPLSEAEFARARDVVVGVHGAADSLFFRSVYLEEPRKADLVPYLEAEHAGRLTEQTQRPPRMARVEYDVLAPDCHCHTRSVVDLAAGRVVSQEAAEPSCYPYFTVGEFSVCEKIILNSQLFKDAIAGFTLPEGFNVTVDPWPYGGADEENPRFMQGLVFAKDMSKKNDDSNHYAYPIPVIPVVDWVTREVVRVDRLATGGAGDALEPVCSSFSASSPQSSSAPRKLFDEARAAEYVPELLDEPLRSDLRPLNVVQPEGASFTVQHDGLVEWQKWRFRLGFTPREGAVLHDVCYQGRPVAYRLSFSELTVPYGDPRPPFHRKQAFDFGDGGVGRAANNLELGCDCLGAIHYLDTWLAAPDGAPTRARAVVCLHEQDNGILWKHTNFRTGRAVVTRARELVVQFICTLANYEYIFAFKLDLAGGLTLETRATGIVSVVAIDDGKRSDYGNIVAPGVLAQNHQHIFAARIDPAIDSYREGDTRVVVEESRGAPKDPQTNPFGNLYHVHRETVERATWVDAAPRLNRVLRMENAHRLNEVSGKNVGYKLVAPPTQLMLAADDSVLARRAPFARHDAWVTGFRDGEFWAAGEFTNQSRAERGGVAAMVDRGDWFTDDGRPADDGEAGRKSGPVVWTVYAFTHNPRVEDWPVMPVEIHQIHLRPADFFTRNPALDVPSKRNDSSVLVHCCDGSAEGPSVQESAPAHLQGSGQGISAEEAGAYIADKAERRLSKAFTGLFKSKGKGNGGK